MLRIAALLSMLALVAVSVPGMAFGQAPPAFSQVTRPVAEVTDAALIEYLLFELIIEPAEPPVKIEVIDITQNGYGADDVMVVYPSMETFMIPAFLPEGVQETMSGWFPDAEFRFDAANRPAAELKLVDAEASAEASAEARQAERALLQDVLLALEQYYGAAPISLLLERDSVGFTFQMWDYQEEAMRYTPPDPTLGDLGVADSVLTALYQHLTAGVPDDTGNLRVSRTAASRALRNLHAVADEQKRQLATKTILLGSFDLDRSGYIDTAPEVDALSCQIWHNLNTAFPGFLRHYGFVDDPAVLDGGYYGSLVFNISERVKGPAARRASVCLAGGEPSPTRPEEIQASVPRGAVSAPVRSFLETEVAAQVVKAGWEQEPGSAAWALSVQPVLVGHYDEDGSGLLDTAREVDAVPCVVWEAVASTYGGLLAGLGFSGSRRYGGERIGIAEAVRAQAYRRITACVPAAATQTITEAGRVPAGSLVGMPSASLASRTSAASRALRNLHAVADEQKRQLATKTILLGSFDLDRSGYIDTAPEVDALSCQIWHNLNTAFPGFLRHYGFVDDPAVLDGGYYGSLVFNISERVKGPAARRASACLAGDEPAPTRPEEIQASVPRGAVSAPVRSFLETEVAAQVVKAGWDQEPGSAAWALSVQPVLVAHYDEDGSGLLDTAREVDAVPCVVWEAVASTYGGLLAGLGFSGSRRYGGERIGIAEAVRAQAYRRITACVP